MGLLMICRRIQIVLKFGNNVKQTIINFPGEKILEKFHSGGIIIFHLNHHVYVNRREEREFRIATVPLHCVRLR